MDRMTEKIMGALAAGRWVVTKRYVKKSIKEGSWVSPLKFAWNYRAVERRKARRTKGPIKGCLFWEMKAVFLMKDKQAEEYTSDL